MTTSGGDSRVSIPSKNRKQIQEIKKSLSAGSNHTDDFIYATLIDCCMDPNESSRRLKMIHDIKEIAGNKHTVEDVYTMLKDCNMDPNEAAQRLLYIDTFHEVKKKQDRRKSISSDTSEEHKQTRGNQWRGTNGGRGTFHSSKVFDDAGGGRNPSSGKDNGVTNRLERVSRPAFPALSGKDNTIHKTKSANVNGTPALSNGSYLHKLVPELLTVRPTDVSSSASDPVVVSSQNTRYTCSVGTIKCEIIKSGGSSASNSRIPVANNFSADIIPVIAESAVSDSKTQLKLEAVEENKSSQLLKEPLKVTVSDCTALSTNTIHSVPIKESEVKLSAPKLDVHSVPEVESGFNLSAPKLDDHLVHEVESELNFSAPKPDVLSVHEEESELNLSAPKVDVMLENLSISSHGSVIFPEHIQVPENYKTQFTFGSLGACHDDCKSLSVTESPQQNVEITTTPSLSNENVSPTAEKVENDHQLPQHPKNELNTEVFEEPSSSIENDSAPPEVESKDHSEHELPSQDGNISSDAAVKHEEIKLKTLLPGGFQNPVPQATHDYSYGFMPHMMAPHFVQLDAPELQNGSPLVASVMGPTTTTQPAVGPQSSIALSPPLFPYLRQPYGSYIPYSPYYPPMYFPQNAPFMSHGVFPQQPPTTMVKFPAPSLNKDGSNEEAPVSQANDNSIHPTLQQGEDPQAWAQAGGREVPNFVPNYYFPLPHLAHPMAFSPFYNSSQTMTSPSQPLVYHHQSHSNNGNLEQPSNQNTVLLNSQTT